MDPRRLFYLASPTMERKEERERESEREPKRSVERRKGRDSASFCPRTARTRESSLGLPLFADPPFPRFLALW